MKAFVRSPSLCSGTIPEQESRRKEVINMKYSKPEIVEAGSAVDAIQSNLSKGMAPTDSQGQGDYTVSSAYEADE
jgi:hypothetical protein